jgi:ribonuclease D
MTPYTYIDSHDALCELVENLLHEPLIALDTESNNLHAYREQVCLIQISTRRADYIIDPLAMEDVSPLGKLMADPHIEKIIHAAENDVSALKRDFAFCFRNLFDTLAAARICGCKQVSLSALLEQYFGVQLDKHHQLDDWGSRPLAPESLVYAQKDTHFLPDLRDLLADKLTALHRWDEAQEVFCDLCYVPPVDQTFNAEGYWRIGLPIKLTMRQMAVLRELYLLREMLARKRDCPPAHIMNDKLLATLARVAPSTYDELVQLSQISLIVLEDYAQQVLDAVTRGLSMPTPLSRPTPLPSDPVVVERYTALREWRRSKANEREVDVDVIVSKDTLWALAERNPAALEAMTDIPGLGVWRLAMYGEEMLDVMRKFRK